ncbi:hypothetical protein [Schlesneria paludicola]|uniref:hypothetical protein n=1 Tax=Schlesneria paludicola TaxID=360056 RepID=UPI0003084CD1|nr:hypothetical protein [Schlesneria paludicola]
MSHAGAMRSPLQILTIIAFGVFGCSQDSKGHTDEANTVAMIQKLGGKVEYDGPGPDRRVTKVYLHRTSVQDSDLTALKTLPKLRNLFLGKTKISDEGLAHLSSITELQTLSLNSTQSTDAGLKSLRTLTQLKTLNLQETATTTTGIASLRKALPQTTIAR